MLRQYLLPVLVVRSNSTFIPVRLGMESADAMLYTAQAVVGDGSTFVTYLYPKPGLVVFPRPCSQNVTGEIVALHTYGLAHSGAVNLEPCKPAFVPSSRPSKKPSPR